MRFAVLCSPESWYLRDLQRAASSRHEIIPVPFSKIASEIKNGQQRFYSGEIDFVQFDAVIVRSMPPGSLEQVVFRMDVLARLEAAGVVVMNPPRALEAAVDKYLTSAKLHSAGLNTPRTIVCQTVEEGLEAFHLLGKDVVIKPLFGGEGRGITRIEDEALALRALKMLTQLGAVVYLQEFIPHEGFDIRLLILGDQVLAMRRRNPHDWRTNVSLGAMAEPVEVDDYLVETARQAAQAIGAPIAGVDILPAQSGKHYVLSEGCAA